MSSLVCPKCGTLSVGRSEDEDGLRARIAELEAALLAFHDSPAGDVNALLMKLEPAEAELATVNSLLDMKREREQHWSDEAWRYKAERDALFTVITHWMESEDEPGDEMCAAFNAYTKGHPDALPLLTRAELAEAERDALRKALALLDDAFPNDAEHAMEQAGVTFTGLLEPREGGEA